MSPHASPNRRTPARFSAPPAAILGAASILAACPFALAQPDPSGIDFVTIGAPGNPAYSGPDVNQTVTGRGSVPYEYRIGRTEVTTSQWMEFYNAFYGRSPHISLPARWGAYQTGNPDQPFALSNVPDSALFPVSGVTWRTGALFCNWLHNDKSTDLSAIMNGAYDASTFGYDGQSRFTDQQAHNPDARYWIPTIDEWIKAVYFDPNHGGQGVPGWWYLAPNGSNTTLIYAPPEAGGQANANFDLPINGQFRIPLMAYPDVASPWGVLDAGGATREMLESIKVVDSIPYRRIIGSHWTSFSSSVDYIAQNGGVFPDTPSPFYGIRVAAAVPAPGSCLVLAGAVGWSLRRRRVPCTHV